MTETTWDTEETSMIIANDEGMYNTAMRLTRNAYHTTDYDAVERLAFWLEEELSEFIIEFSYSDVDLDNVDCEEIAAEYMEGE